MRILVLGGTVFLGRHLVEAAVRAGHEVTLFNRGQSNPGLFPDVEQVHGDRATDLGRLSGRRFEAVIDTSGYLPRIVREGVSALRRMTEHYTFISTISVYSDLSVIGVDEEGPLLPLSEEGSEDIPRDYGALKALCEEAVSDAYGSAALIIRPGLIVGPWDPTDRFTYWPYRVARGGDILAPGRPDRRIQFIDVRDLAAWTVGMVGESLTGTYNADGPEGRATMNNLLTTCLQVTGSGARIHWAPEDFLAKHGVGEWMEMPLYIRETPEQIGFHEVDCSRAIAAGLTFRPIAHTVRDTLKWHQTREPYTWEKTGINPSKESRLIEELGSVPH
jgi:2'-hydroxyisoflavone reductase